MPDWLGVATPEQLAHARENPVSDVKMDDMVGTWFGVARPPCLSMSLLGAEDVFVSHIRRARSGDGGDQIILPQREAYLVTLYLRDTCHSDILNAAEETPPRAYREGSVCIIDMSRATAVRLHAPLDCLVFYLPYRLLDDIARLPQAPPRAKLRCRRGEDDDTVRHLGDAVRTLLDAPSAPATEALRHVGIALGAHLLQFYAEPASTAKAEQPLSIWAEMDSKAFMIAHHARPLRIRDVADVAGLPQTRFVKAFRQAVGVSPARWLQRYRVARAKESLAEDDLPLAAVARMCGFRGANELAGIFRRETGLSPDEWLGRT